MKSLCGCSFEELWDPTLRPALRVGVGSVRQGNLPGPSNPPETIQYVRQRLFSLYFVELTHIAEYRAGKLSARARYARQVEEHAHRQSPCQTRKER